MIAPESRVKALMPVAGSISGAAMTAAIDVAEAPTTSNNNATSLFTICYPSICKT